MRFLTLVLAAGALAGCRPTYYEPDPTPIEIPERPPEKILRRPPDFTFKDYASGKTFFYRLYSDGEIKQEIITTIRTGDEYEMPASPEETDYAMQVLLEDWQEKGLEQQLAYHNAIHAQTRRRRDAGFDEKIHYAEAAIVHLKDQLFNLEADLQSSKQTSGYDLKPEKQLFLERSIAETKIALGEEIARLEAFRYVKALSDRELIRSTRVSTK